MHQWRAPFLRPPVGAATNETVSCPGMILKKTKAPRTTVQGDHSSASRKRGDKKLALADGYSGRERATQVKQWLASNTWAYAIDVAIETPKIAACARVQSVCRQKERA